MSGGQFDWGGRLLKGNGGAQRFLQNGWKSFAECKGIKELDCETYKSSRDESRGNLQFKKLISVIMRISLRHLEFGTLFKNII